MPFVCNFSFFCMKSWLQPVGNEEQTGVFYFEPTFAAYDDAAVISIVVDLTTD